MNCQITCELKNPIHPQSETSLCHCQTNKQIACEYVTKPSIIWLSETSVCDCSLLFPIAKTTCEIICAYATTKIMNYELMLYKKGSCFWAAATGSSLIWLQQRSTNELFTSTRQSASLKLHPRVVEHRLGEGTRYENVPWPCSVNGNFFFSMAVLDACGDCQKQESTVYRLPLLRLCLLVPSKTWNISSSLLQWMSQWFRNNQKTLSFARWMAQSLLGNKQST